MIIRIISLFVLVTLLPWMGFSQNNYNIHFGTVGAFSVKGSFFDQDHKTTEHYKPFFATQITGALYIEDPNSLSFLLKMGLSYEVDDYLVNNTQGISIHTDQLSAVFNPEVLFPLSNQKFKIGCGIGIEYLLSKQLDVNGESGTVINKLYYNGNLENKQRNVVPFINADFWYQFSSKIWFGAGIRQPLLGSYYKNEMMYFGNTSFNLRHQPTYFSASVFYQFF